MFAVIYDVKEEDRTIVSKRATFIEWDEVMTFLKRLRGAPAVVGKPLLVETTEAGGRPRRGSA